MSPRLPDPVPSLVDLHRVREPGDRDGIVRLNRNERQYPLPDWFVEKMAHSVTSELFTNYPVTDGFPYGQLGSYVGLKEEQLLLTPGSDGAVKALFQAYLRPGDAVVMLDPSYAMYGVYARMFQAQQIPIPFDERLEPDLDKLMASVTPGVRIVMIRTPISPPGTMIAEEVLLQVVRRATAVGALVAVDEAYYPFSRFTILPRIKEFPHLVVLRTFSKAAGLAALRIGFAAGHEDVIANLFKGTYGSRHQQSGSSRRIPGRR